MQDHQNAHPRNEHPHIGIAILLAMSMALGPLAIDTYLPAFPAMAVGLAVSVHDISFSITIYVLALAIGQLIAGPLSDRFGRSLVMLSGVGIFALASGLITQATTNEQLMMYRGLHGFGGGCVAVCVPAIVRDRLSGQEAAKFFSTIGLIMILAPAVAPSIGSLILTSFEWQAIFVMLFVYAVVLSVLLKVIVFANPQKPAPHHAGVSVLKRYQSVIATRPALRYMFLQMLCFCVMLLFISHSSFIYQEHYGATPTEFAFLFGANIILMMVANLTNRRLLKSVPSRRILRGAVTIQAVGICLLIIATSLNASLWFFLPAMMVTVGAMGAITPNTQANFMDYFPQHGGTAAALLGATQFSLASVIAMTSAALLPETVMSVVMTQATCCVICLFLVWTDPGATQNQLETA